MGFDQSVIVQSETKFKISASEIQNFLKKCRFTCFTYSSPEVVNSYRVELHLNCFNK